MKHWIYDSKFNTYVQALGSNYAAILYICGVARRRMKRVNNCISESEAISWIITGVEPKYLHQKLEYAETRKNLDIIYANDRLLYIDDIDVRESTRETILVSKKEKHLIYKYKDVLDESRKARVRILSNLIWDEMKQIRIENMI